MVFFSNTHQLLRPMVTLIVLTLPSPLHDSCDRCPLFIDVKAINTIGDPNYNSLKWVAWIWMVVGNFIEEWELGTIQHPKDKQGISLDALKHEKLL